MLLTFSKDPITNLFPRWSEFPVEDREDIRYLLSNLNHWWARQRLQNAYGLDSDRDTDDSNSRISQ